MQYHQVYTIYGTCLRLSILPKKHANQYLHSMFCKIIALKSVSLHLAECVMQKKGWQDTKYCNLFLLSAGPIMRRRGHGVTENRKISPFLLFLPLNRGQRVKGEGGGIHIFCECWVCKTARPFSQQDMTIQQTAFQKHWPTNSKGGFCNISSRNMQTWEFGNPLKKWLFLFSAIRRMQKHAKNFQIWRWATRKGRLLSKMPKFLGDWEKSPKNCPQVGKWERRVEWGIW